MKGCDSLDFNNQYRNLWAIAWNFHKQHYPVTGTDKYWDTVIGDYGKLYRENQDKPGFELLKALLMAAFEELERVGGCYGRYAQVGKAAGGCAEGEV